MERWGIRTRAALLFAILLLDGALLGAAAGAVSAREVRKTVHVSAQVKPVALTFDDGPDPQWTPLLLDGLAARGVRVSFFLMGQHIEGNEDLVARMHQEGHLIGNHSYRHIQLTKAGEEAVLEAVERTQELVEEITGDRPQYLRPPYGDWNESLEEQVDLSTVLWSVDSLDWKLKDTSRIVSRVLADVEPGDIILMHDIFRTSVLAAFEIIDRLEAEGYVFVTVDELRID
ncbi:MAG: polysaccharide deacetylase family protein [Clostridiales bacterium]|nr:polysaccharide deacetylase family protein [Clostridiales bacterium]